MRIIYFKENEKEIWNEFIAENCSESFLQSWEWGEFQKSLGRKIWRMAVVEDNLFGEWTPAGLQYKSAFSSESSAIDSNEALVKEKLGNWEIGKLGNLAAVALVVKHNLPFGKSYLYCPRGMVANKFKVQSSKFKVLDLLFNEIKNIAGKERAMFLRFDPPVDWNSCWFHSGDSPVEPKCKSCAKDSTALKGLWSQHKLEYSWILKKSPSEIQPRDTLILDLAKSEEELLLEMKPKTRYNIRLAERKKLEIRNWEIGKLGNWESFKKDFEEFWRLVEETSKRDGFKSHSKDYYWKMLESLSCGNEEKLPSNPVAMPESYKIKSAMDNLGIASALRSLAMTEISECRLRARLYLAEYNDEIIAANIILYFGDLAIYLHGASSSEYRNLMATYLLQWRQIMDAKNAGCKKYDFWGVSPLQATFRNVAFGLRSVNKKSNWQGITRFKKGFGGEEKNYIGAYDAVFDNIGYAIYKFIKLKVHKVIMTIIRY